MAGDAGPRNLDLMVSRPIASARAIGAAPPYRRRSHLMLYVFLVALTGPASDVVAGTAGPAWLAWLALAAFAAAFVTVIETTPGHVGALGRGALSSRAAGACRVVAVAGLAAIAVATTLAYGADWFVLFVFVVATLASSVPLRLALPAIVAVTAVVVALSLSGSRDSASLVTAASWALSIAMAGYISLLLRRRGALITELRATQGEVARMAAADAVTEERLRFARDLHDLLGHSLSVIVLKAELARRLLDREEAPGAARAEVGDVEQIARRALEEVREAVTGYRARSLAAELERARVALEAAGVELQADIADEALPPDVETLLARVLREAATNIVRHSGAISARVTLTQPAAGARLEVSDDGVGGAAPLASGGTGLQGLAERVETAGGRFAAGPLAAGGFVVTVEVPLGAPAGAPAAGAEPATAAVAAAAVAPESVAAVAADAGAASGRGAS
jgi:two-component system, NarL family, sensor histidine kinase DesK